MSNQLLKSIKILNRFPRKLWPLPPNAPHYVIQRIVEYFPESIESWCGILRIWMLCLWEMEQVGPIIILQRNRGCEKNLYLSKLIYWTLHQTKNIQFGLLFSRVHFTLMSEDNKYCVQNLFRKVKSWVQQLSIFYFQVYFQLSKVF